MPFDQVALAGARVLLPLYKFLEDIYEKWKLIRSFNRDFLKARHQLDAQFIILEHIGHRHLLQLETGIDPDDKAYPRTRVIYEVLGDIKAIFENIDKLLLDYPRHRNKLRKERPVNHDQNRIKEITPLSSAPSTIIDSSSKTKSLASPISPISTIDETATNQKAKPSTQKRRIRALPNLLKGMLKSSVQLDNSSTTTQPVAGESSATPPAPAQQLPRNQAGVVVEQLMEHNRSTESTAAAHETTEFLHKVKWAREDRDKLWVYIKELRQLNRTLDTLTQLKPYLSGPQIIKRSQEEINNVNTTISSTQEALQRFHQALRDVNSGSETFSFAIQLTLDYDQAGKMFREEHLPHKHRSDSSDYYFFNMQGLQRRDKSSTQKLIVVQTRRSAIPQSASYYPMAEDELIKNFDLAYGSKQYSPKDTFSELGVVAEHASSRDFHRLFKDCANDWTCPGSLTDFIQGPDASQKLTSLDRVGLAKLISASYLYLSRIGSGPLTIKLESLLYFAVKGENVDWTGEDGLITRPYLLCGLGEKSKSIVGGRPSTNRDPVLEFACLLTQIGCCTIWDIRKPTVHTKQWVPQQIDNLNREVALPYAEIVRECLQYRPGSLPGTDDDVRRNDFLLDKMIRLNDLSTILTGTLAADRMVEPHQLSIV